MSNNMNFFPSITDIKNFIWGNTSENTFEGAIFKSNPMNLNFLWEPELTSDHFEATVINHTNFKIKISSDGYLSVNSNSVRLSDIDSPLWRICEDYQMTVFHMKGLFKASNDRPTQIFFKIKFNQLPSLNYFIDVNYFKYMSSPTYLNILEKTYLAELADDKISEISALIVQKRKFSLILNAYRQNPILYEIPKDVIRFIAILYAKILKSAS